MDKIFKTDKHDQFILYEQFHRATKNKFIKKLEKKILKENKLAQWPIWVTEKLEIVDGRHRFLIAKKLKLAIYYVFKYKSKDYHSWIKKTYGKFDNK
jgi:hypothetical protein